jgi:hypothetical protein
MKANVRKVQVLCREVGGSTSLLTVDQPKGGRRAQEALHAGARALRKHHWDSYPQRSQCSLCVSPSVQ